jgi:iron complex outermembrane receptor protein
MKKLSLGLLLAITLTSSQLDAFDSEGELWDEDIPIVLSATRLKQAQSEAPASITIIDRSMLESLGVRKLPEIFRLVPGMQVGYVNGNQAAVGYHGLTDDNSRRMQVLIDGRSIFQSALSRILWFDQPLAIENIERIEVIRGPNTAAYGSNSYLAIINIITQHPSDSPGIELVFRKGQRGVNDFSGSFSNVIKELEYRVTVANIKDGGFDLQKDFVTERHDNADAKFIQVDGIYNQDTEQYRIQAGYKTGNREVDQFYAEITPFHDINNDHSFLQFSYTDSMNQDRQRKIKFNYDNNTIKENWMTCIPRLLLTTELFDLYTLDSSYTDSLVDALFNGAPPPTPSSVEIANQTSLVLARAFTDGAIESCGYANQNLNETRIDLEWEETFRLNPDIRMVAGANLRKDSVKGESFFEGIHSKYTSRIFTNLEWRQSDQTIYNFGANLEKDQNAGTEFSPRIAVIRHVGKQHTFRAIAALATRTPDHFEESANRKYLVRGVNPILPITGAENFFYQHSESKGGLTAEKIHSLELGYFGNFSKNSLLLDVKLFKDRLTDIIQGNTNIDLFSLSNSGKITFSGVEAQLDYKISNQFRFWNSYAHLDIDDTVLNVNLKSAITNSGSSALFYTPGNNWNMSIAAYSNSTWYGSEFLRTDISAAYNLALNDAWTLKTRLTLQHRFDDDYLFDANNVFEDKNTFYLQFFLSQN